MREHGGGGGGGSKGYLKCSLTGERDGGPEHFWSTKFTLEI